MEAKLKADYRWNTIILFSGHEYVKTEFRPVPEGCEALAQVQEGLEVRQKAVKEPEPVAETIEPVVEEIVEEPELPEAEEVFKPIRKRHKKLED